MEALVRRFKTDLHNCVAYIQEPRLLKEKIRALFENYVQRADMVSSECPALPPPHCHSSLPLLSVSPNTPGGDCRAELRPATGVCPPAGTPGEEPGHTQEESGQGRRTAPHRLRPHHAGNGCITSMPETTLRPGSPNIQGPTASSQLLFSDLPEFILAVIMAQDPPKTPPSNHHAHE